VCVYVQEIADEFSHTLLHGVQLQKALPAAGGSSNARPLPPKPIAGNLPVSYYDHLVLVSVF